MNQRLERLDFLAEFLRTPAREFITAVQKDLGITMFIVHTWRSTLDQLKIYAQGREMDRTEGVWKVVNEDDVVTNAMPGSSPHNVITYASGGPASMAFDAVPMDGTAKLLWDTPRDIWDKIYKVSWKFGFDPLGDVTGAYYKRDLCHFEEPAWKLKLGGLRLIQPSVDVRSFPL